MADFPMMPLWTDSYLADTHPELSLEEHGCYFLLLQAAWRRKDCDLPDDDAWFCKWLGIHGNKWRVLRKSTLERFFTQLEDGNWTQKRLRKEREIAEKTRRNRRESSAKGNAIRWGKTNENNNVDDPQAIPRARVLSPTPTPKEEERKKETPTNVGAKKERKKAPASPSTPALPLAAIRSDRRSKIDPGWKPSDVDRAFAHQRGFGDHEIDEMTLAFVACHEGKGSLMVSWAGAWRTWVMRAPSFARPPPLTGGGAYRNPPKGRCKSEEFAEAIRIMRNAEHN